VEKRDQKEEQYLTDVKALKEQITKLEMKNAFLTKEHEKFKATLTESVKSAVAVKQSFYSSAESTPTNMDGTKFLQRSRFSRSQGQNDNVLNLAVVS
jgi:regulator of replication initiation timing